MYTYKHDEKKFNFFNFIWRCWGGGRKKKSLCVLTFNLPYSLPPWKTVSTSSRVNWSKMNWNSLTWERRNHGAKRQIPWLEIRLQFTQFMKENAVSCVWYPYSQNRYSSQTCIRLSVSTYDHRASSVNREYDLCSHQELSLAAAPALFLALARF